MRDDVFSCSYNYERQSEIRKIVVVDADRIVLGGNFVGACSADYLALMVDASGLRRWEFASGNNGDGMTAMVVGPSGEVCLTGKIDVEPTLGLSRTFVLNTNGTLRWNAEYFPPDKRNLAYAVAADAVGNVYVAGEQSGSAPATTPDFLILKYNEVGQVEWVQRYDGPAGGSDIASCVIVSSDGAIYMAGTSANISGGLDFTLVKYVQVQSIQVQTNQTVLLQFLGTPGQSYRFQATTNFSYWEDLGASVADPLGLYQWLDTNPPVALYKFYRTVSP